MGVLGEGVRGFIGGCGVGLYKGVGGGIVEIISVFVL